MNRTVPKLVPSRARMTVLATAELKAKVNEFQARQRPRQIRPQPPQTPDEATDADEADGDYAKRSPAGGKGRFQVFQTSRRDIPLPGQQPWGSARRPRGGPHGGQSRLGSPGHREPEPAAPRSPGAQRPSQSPPLPRLPAPRSQRDTPPGVSPAACGAAGAGEPASPPRRVAHLSCPHPPTPTSSRCPRLPSCSPRSPRSPPPSHRDDSSPSCPLGNGPASSSRAVASHSLLPARPLPLQRRARRTPRPTRPPSLFRNPRLLPTPGRGFTT